MEGGGVDVVADDGGRAVQALDYLVRSGEAPAGYPPAGLPGSPEGPPELRPNREAQEASSRGRG